ncbi:MAG: hypothetical protein RIG62_06855 [Cyclobacteriaceae bacterium]
MLISFYATVLLQIGDLIEGIFKAGFWVAIILVAIIGLAVFWLVRKFRGRG